MDLGLRLASEPTSAVILCAALGEEVSRMPPRQCKKAYDITKQKVTEACSKARSGHVILPLVPELPADPSQLNQAIIQHAFGGIPPQKNEDALTQCLELVRFVPMRSTDRRLKQDDLGCNNMMVQSSSSSSFGMQQVPGPMMVMMQQMMAMQQQLLQAIGGQNQLGQQSVLWPAESDRPAGSQAHFLGP